MYHYPTIEVSKRQFCYTEVTRFFFKWEFKVKRVKYILAKACKMIFKESKWRKVQSENVVSATSFARIFRNERNSAHGQLDHKTQPSLAHWVVTIHFTSTYVIQLQWWVWYHQTTNQFSFQISSRTSQVGWFHREIKPHIGSWERIFTYCVGILGGWPVSAYFVGLDL